MAHPGGRPTKYDSKYVQEMIDFFNVDAVRETTKTITTKNGTIIEEEGYLPNPMPFFIDFADKIGVHHDTLAEWANGKDENGKLKHPEFSAAYSQVKKYQERHLVNNALLNNYNAGFASLVAKNWLGWKDKTENDNRNTGEVKVRIVNYGDEKNKEA